MTKIKTKFKQTEIGLISEGWRISKINDCCKIVKKQFKPSNKDIRKYIGLEHIAQNSLRLIEISTTENIRSNKFEFESEQILFGKLRPYFRKVYLPKFDGVCSTDIWVIDTQGQNDQTFFFYFFADNRIVKEASNSSAGTRMPRARWDYLGELEFLIPSSEEQKKIGKILYDLDTKIENLQQQNKILEQIAQAIFKSWFVDFDGQTEFVDSELGKIPKGWKVVNMPEIIEINPSRNLKKDLLTPYLGMTDIPIYSSRISRFYLRMFTSGMKFMNGDTLVARITPSLENGKTAFVDFLQNNEVGWGSTEYIVLRPRNLLPPEYGYCFARTDEFRSHAIANMTGTSGRQRVPENCFDDYKVVNPPIDLAETFGKISKKLFLKIRENGEMCDVLITLRDSLLPKLMSGEIRV